MSVILPRRFVDQCSLNGFALNQSRTNLSNNLVSISWNPDGEFLYSSLKIGRTLLMLVDQVGGVNWDISADRASPINFRYGFIPEIGSGGNCWSGIVTKAPDLTDGGQLLLALSSGTGVTKIAQYTLPFPWEVRQGLNNPDISQGPPYYPTYTPALVGQLDLNVWNGSQGVNDLQMSPDGTRLMAISSNIANTATLNQWDLTTDYDPYISLKDIAVSGAEYTRVDILGYTWTSLHISRDGRCLYLATSGEIALFKMVQPWELSSLITTPVNTFDVSAQVSAIGSIFINDNATELYVLGLNNGDLYRYSKK
jgi:hypothetical protein